MTAGKSFKRLVRARARRTGESYVTARRALLAPRTEDTMATKDDDRLVEVTLEGVRTEPGAPGPYLALRERGGERLLPVFIGAPEAAAIAFALQGRASPRPMTHDALKQVVDAAGGRLARIVLGHRPETSTFTADVVMELAGGGERRFDWRVSDAVAVAVRCDPRPVILVPPALLDLPSPTRGAAYVLRCACGASVRFGQDDLEPAPGSPAHARLEGTCGACGATVRALVERPGAPPPGA